MNKCNYCKVNLDLNLTYCPLCLRQINEEPPISKVTLYPEYSDTQQPRHLSMIFKLFLFLSIMVGSICLVINILTLDKNFWSIYVMITILYLWLLVKHTVIIKTQVGRKILFQTIGLSIFLYIIDMTAKGYGWAMNFVIPFIIVTSTVLMIILIYSNLVLFTENIGYLIIMIFIGFVPTLFYLIGFTDVLWPSVVSLLNAMLVTVSLLIFLNKNFKNQIDRIFHF